MNSEVLASDEITRIKTIIHTTGDDAGTYHLEEVQECDDIVEVNKALYNSVDERARFGNGFVRVASVPLVVFFEQWKKGLFRGAKLSKDDQKFLNDRDNQAFRTRPGRL